MTVICHIEREICAHCAETYHAEMRRLDFGNRWHGLPV
jgi:hypothetical protein